MTTRREFLATGIAGVLAAALPPAYARAGSLMPITVRKTSTGLCYVTVESLSLVQFGNRVPNFEFEVEADGDNLLGQIVGRARVFPVLKEFGGIKETPRDVVVKTKDGRPEVLASEFFYSTDLRFESPGDRLRRVWADGVELPVGMFRAEAAPFVGAR